MGQVFAANVGALRRRVPEPVTPWRQLIKDTKAGYLYCRLSVIRQQGVELDLKTTLDFTRQALAQNPMCLLHNSHCVHKDICFQLCFDSILKYARQKTF